MPKPTILILGAGGNIGANLTSTFARAGYAIALASRSRTPGKTPEGYLNIKTDLTNPSSLSTAFEKTIEAFGTPNVVIYNAAMMRVPPDPEDIFSVSVEDMASDINLMTVSAYAAAKEAVRAWDLLPKNGGKKVFIYTGNMLNKTIMASPYVLTLGVGKAGAAYWIGSASKLCAGKGYKFYYADQHLPDGGPMGTEVGGPAAAEFYWKLVTEDDVEVPWDATFVEGKGYVDFSALNK